MMHDILKYTISNIRQRKLRSFLTTLSILIGITAIFALISFGQGINKYMNDFGQELGTDKIFMLPGGGLASSPGTSNIIFTKDDIDFVRKIKGVDEVTGMYAMTGKIAFKDYPEKYPFVIGFSTENEDKKLVREMFAGIDVIEGRNLKKGDVLKATAGYSYTVPNRMFKKRVNLGDKIEINDIDVEIVGFYEEVGSPTDDAQVYISQEGFEEIFEIEEFEYIYLRASPDQNPNDLALIGIDTLMQNLKITYPEMIWAQRIKFGGLIDIPDENGETRIQGPVGGIAVNLFSVSSPERKILNIKDAIVNGHIPNNPGEILMADEFADKLKIKPGDVATLLSSTMYSSMAMTNFIISGTVHFGITAMDRGTIIADLSDVQTALDMQDAAGEILGFFPDDNFYEEKADQIAASFNKKYKDPDDQFSPVMGTLPQESGLAEYMNLIDSASILIVGIFILAMSIVLWNAGLMGSLRRYGEIGVRLAVGEDKRHIYKTLILESVMIGIIGSFLGTVFGLIPAYLMQTYGLDLSFLFERSSMMISSVYYAQINFNTYIIGFIPGILSTVLGTSIAGIGIYKRQTSQLFKELEV